MTAIVLRLVLYGLEVDNADVNATHIIEEVLIEQEACIDYELRSDT